MARILGAALSLAIVASVPAGASAAQRLPDVGPGPAVAAPLPAPPGRTTLLSEARNGGFPNQRSLQPAMTPSGRFVAFSSVASDLVANDEPGTQDVFVLDRRTGRMERAPLPDGFEPDARTAYVDPSISADGRWVAYTYHGQPPFEGNFLERYVVVWDRQRDVAELVTFDSEWVWGIEPSISADGRYVAFTTIEEVEGDKDGQAQDVVRWDRRTGQMTLISEGFNGEPIGGEANAPSISGNGNLVAFVSDGGDSVVDEDTGPGTQVYVRSVNAGRTERISAAANGGPARDDSLFPAISSDGRYVAFASLASNLTPEGSGGLFRRDRQTGRTVLVSVTATGQAANGAHGQPSITGDGGMIAWASSATNLVPETAGGIRPAATSRGGTEVYIRDLAARETVLISVSRDNGPGFGGSLEPSIAGGGRYVAFASASDILVGGDDNDQRDVFLRDLPPVPVVNPGSLNFGPATVDVDSLPLAATVGNAGWSPLAVRDARISGGNAGDFRVVANGCRDRLLGRAQACTVSVVFKPRGGGTRTATLAVSNDADTSASAVRLRGQATEVEVFNGTLEISPDLGRPGVVTMASGRGFPPNTSVRLRWSEGITPTMDPVVVDARGRFEIPVLVFHNDRTGRRELIAEPVDGAPFAPATADMLVIKPAAIPPRFETLRLIDIPLVLVFRG